MNSTTDEIEIPITRVFRRAYAEYQKKEYKIIVEEGGTGSSKSISLAQLCCYILQEEEGVLITIARKTFPALVATTMKDVIAQLDEMGIYDEQFHNKATHTFTYPKTGSQIEFLAVDQPMKVRSRKRHYLWMNEANEFKLEDFRQLALRTSKMIFMDYNPSYQFHWIYDEVLPRKDCIIHRSSYKDNPFLPKSIVNEIEGYKDKDQNYWKIYGLGERGLAESNIYTHWELVNELPEKYDRRHYGLDFGFNNPTALIEVREKDKDLYWKEHIYQSHLTNDDLIDLMNSLGIDKSTTIFSDTEPARIEAIERAGYSIESADKDVKAGIDYVKSHKFYITKDSINLQKEAKSYSWKTKDGKSTDDPVKVNDHGMDAGRYASLPFTDEGGDAVIFI